MSARLQPPKKTSAGYYLALNTSVAAPELRWASGVWVADVSQDAAWISWADAQRNELLGEMLSHGNWFSRPPRRDILEPLFTPWMSRKMDGKLVFACRTPDIPGEEGSSGRATWQLDGLLMTPTAIHPVWSLVSVALDETLDQISLFGDGDTVDEELPETREIQLEEIPDAPSAGGPPLVLRSREWETRKFLAKERVREARLKAQIAAHMAIKEEQRFYNLFGDLDDRESRFSDYDLSDVGDGGSISEEELEDFGVATGAGAGAGGGDKIRHV
jgi:hypothetical protein